MAPRPPTADLVSAWLCLASVRGRGHWLDAAADGAQDRLDAGLDDLDEAQRVRWLHTASRGWVQRARGPFRALADALAPRVEAAPATVPALLHYWRITGRRSWLRAALDAVPGEVKAGDLEAAAALHAAWLATADGALLERAIACAEAVDPQDAPLSRWPLLAELAGLEIDDFEVAARQLNACEPAMLLPPLAALCLPPLTLRVRYALQQELREGPVAEAITCPYPALRIQFTEHTSRHQVDITPVLDGVAGETLYDVAVVSEFLDMLLDSVDRTPLLAAAPRRRGARKGLLGRR